MQVNGYVEMYDELGMSSWIRIAEFKFYDEATKYAKLCAVDLNTPYYSYRACKSDGTVLWNSDMLREAVA